MKLNKKILKNTAVTFLIASMLIPANLIVSAANNNGKPSKDTNEVSDSNTISIITSLDSCISQPQPKLNSNLKSNLQPESKNSYPYFTLSFSPPAVAIVGRPIKISIFPLDLFDNCKMKIEGSNGYSELLQKGKNTFPFKDGTSKDADFHASNYHWVSYWEWTPDQVGIFNIVVYWKNILKVSRKVYVNSDEGSSDKGYFQLGDLKISIDPITSSTGISAAITDITSTHDKNPGRIKFIIGEPLVWSKTIKESALGNNPLNKTYSISEKNDGFKFNQGIYNIEAFVKGVHSIEYEDVKAVNYKKNGLDNIKLELDNEELTKNEHYKFTAKVSGVDESIKNNLLYAFILWDKSGWRVVQDYSKKNTYDFSPKCLCISQGKYRIYARVKQSSDSSSNLPNSYEAEVSKELNIEGYPKNIKINNIKIDAYEAVDEKQSSKDIRNIDTGYEKHTCKEGFAVSHEMNIIKVTASQSLGLKYKAYAIHDGYCYPLCDYTYSNWIPFYPKSSGKYKLIILAKECYSGSEDARKEYNITVTNVNGACKD